MADGIAIGKIVEGYDASDPFSRRALPVTLPARSLYIGVLTGAEREFFGDADTERLYDNPTARAQALGAIIVPFNYAPFRAAAERVYNGAWVAEGLAALSRACGA